MYCRVRFSRSERILSMRLFPWWPIEESGDEVPVSELTRGEFYLGGNSQALQAYLAEVTGKPEPKVQTLHFLKAAVIYLVNPFPDERLILDGHRAKTSLPFYFSLLCIFC
jgi:hypothetical protein